MPKIALLFSGQGAQRVGMGTDLAASSPAARKILELSNEILPSDFLTVLRSGPEETLTRTAYCQPALYLHGLALLSVLKEQKPDFTFDATAGLSSANSPPTPLLEPFRLQRAFGSLPNVAFLWRKPALKQRGLCLPFWVPTRHSPPA